MTETEVLERLYRRYSAMSYNARRFVCADHVPQDPYGGAPVADFVAVDSWKGRDQWPILGFEIKCSRRDWLRELSKPWKAEAWKRYCTRWYLVTSDASIVKADELPIGWGHLTVRGSGLATLRAAPKLRPEPMAHPTHVALLRQTQKSALSRAVPLDIEAAV